jgi:hypothetical protein
MRSGLMRMSEADPAAVKQYLRGQKIEPEIIDWKYFDRGFNRDRERGVVWVREDQVAGFLGLIPFRVEKNEQRAECAWSCDWSVDPAQGGGMGLLLVKRARELYDGIFNLGGNENTRQIFPRLADRTVPDAGISLVLPLRLGSIIAGLPRGFVRRLFTRQEKLQKIPLRWVRSAVRSLVTIEPGLSPQVLSFADATLQTGWRPVYDAGFLDWQFVRCPAISAWNCSISSESPLRTAGLVWRSRSSKKLWRFVFWGETHDLEKMKILTAAIVSFAYQQGCIALVTIASQRQSDLLSLLRRRGFLRHGLLPFYAMRGRCAELPVDDFAALSYLDADLAYRFESYGVESDCVPAES